MLVSTAMLVFGLVILVLGGEATVQGSLNIARRLGWSPAFAGVAIVGFGTSAPELFLSVQAALAGSDGLAIGNILGSNIANVWLVGGLILLFSHITKQQEAAQPSRLHSLAAGLALISLALLSLRGEVSSLLGWLLLIPFAIYACLAIKEASAQKKKQEKLPDAFPSLRHGLLLAVGGLALMLAGAEQVVAGGQSLARLLGMPETLIGLSVLALGTSLPEVVATIVAVRRKAIALATGGIFGSTIFNSWLILPLSAIVLPLSIKDNLPDLLIAPVALGFFVLGTASRRAYRFSIGLACIVCYLLYWVFLATRL